MAVDILSAFVEKLKETPPELTADTTPPAPRAPVAGYQRGLKVTDAPPVSQEAHVSIDEARDLIWQEMTVYARLVEPEHMLLIKAVPGVGKTTAVRLAEELAAQGRRVLYAAPRFHSRPARHRTRAGHVLRVDAAPDGQ